MRPPPGLPQIPKNGEFGGGELLILEFPKNGDFRGGELLLLEIPENNGFGREEFLILEIPKPISTIKPGTKGA